MLFKSKKIAQVISAWIKSKNSLVKHFEDMRLCRPSKEYLQVWFNPPRDGSMSCLTTKGMRTIGVICARSYIYHALTVSPIVSTTLVEQFWTSAKSKTLNNVKHISAKVAGKLVSISEASIRTDLIFNDADGIDSLQNQAIFDAIQRMGYEGDLTDEGVSSERLSAEQSSPSPAPTSEVPNESLPDSTSAQPSEEPFEQQPDPSPSPSPSLSPQDLHPQLSPIPIVPDSIPEQTGENLGDHSSNDTSLLGNEDDITLPNVYDLCISLCKQVSDQAKEIKLLKSKITKLKKQAKPVIKHFKAYLKTVSLQKRLSKKSSSKKQRMHKKNVSKQGRKIAKGESTVQRDPMFDVMPEDNIDHMETYNAQSEGRTREVVDEDKEIDKVRLSTEDEVNTNKEGVSTDKEKDTDEQIGGADDQVESTKEKNEGTEEIFESTEEQRQDLNQESIKKSNVTSLKHCLGNFKHSELKSKKFEDIQAMNEKIKRSDEDFIAIGSVEDESLIKRMNKKDSSKVEEIKPESKEEVKEEDKGEENTRLLRKKMKSRKRRFKQHISQDDPSDTENENDELRLCLTIAPDEDKEVDYEILDKKYPIIDWKNENLGSKP
ncbi:hypothetical protein Tco_0768096 [Tanacetum coccineum]